MGGAAETVSGGLGASFLFLPLALVALVRLGAGAERLRFVAAEDALPDTAALMFSMVAA
jgi:hypothetical protein